MSWDEDEIHRWLARAKRPSTFVGSTGHDAAVVAQVERHSDYVAPAAPEAPQVADATHGDDHGGEGEG